MEAESADNPLELFREDRVQEILVRMGSGRLVPEDEALRLLQLDEGKNRPRDAGRP